MESARGTVIRLTKLTESSLIVHWLTEEHGLIKTVAKGARQAKGRFAGRLDLFLEAELEWTRSRRGELHQLREVQVVDYRMELRKSYRDALLGGYFCQLLGLVVELDHPVPELYDLLKRALRYLGEGEVDKKGLLHFEKELARLLGIGREGGAAIIQTYGRLPNSRDQCLDILD